MTHRSTVILFSELTDLREENQIGNNKKVEGTLPVPSTYNLLFYNKNF